jgi:hypothetical protein
MGIRRINFCARARSNDIGIIGIGDSHQKKGTGEPVL